MREVCYLPVLTVRVQLSKVLATTIASALMPEASCKMSIKLQPFLLNFTYLYLCVFVVGQDQQVHMLCSSTIVFALQFVRVSHAYPTLLTLLGALLCVQQLGRFLACSDHKDLCRSPHQPWLRPWNQSSANSAASNPHIIINLCLNLGTNHHPILHSQMAELQVPHAEYWLSSRMLIGPNTN